MRWPLYFVSNKIKNSLHRVSLMSIDGRRRFGAIEFERYDNHEKTIQLYPGTVRVREAFVLRSIEVYPWFNDLVTAWFPFLIIHDHGTLYKKMEIRFVSRIQVTICHLNPCTALSRMRFEF